ncbi:MAG: hypothetical protein ACRCX2_04665 [Paraclostridium sp.]
MDLLLKTIPITKQNLVIFTPLGFLDQSHPDGIDAWGLDGVNWQTHRSGWTPEDFPSIEGGSWSFFVCSDFHHYNCNGVPLNPPRGAFFAIWTT